MKTNKKSRRRKKSLKKIARSVVNRNKLNKTKKS